MNKSSIKNLARKVPAPLIALALFILSSQSTLPLPPTPLIGVDKIAHFIAYGALAFAIALMFPLHWWKKPLKTALIAITIASFYGITDEIHQSFVPERDTSIADWVADTLGALCGTAFYYVVFVKKRLRRY